MEVTIYEKDADEFGEMSLVETINWLTLLAEAQPCSPEDITFRLRQMGDPWDGYSCASIEIVRLATDEEKREANRRSAEAEEQRRLDRESQERATLAALQAKYGAAA